MFQNALIITTTAAAVYFAHTISKKKQDRKRTLSPKEERVIILGCSSGIGKDCALQYASRGAKLILFARRQNLLEELQKECEAAGSPQVEYFTGDVTKEQDIEQLAKFTQEKLNGIDTVIYCAGMISVRPFLESSGVTIHNKTVSVDAEKNQAVDKALLNITTINYFSAIWTAKLFLPLLISTSAAPNFLVISSMAGKVGAPTRAMYAGSKHALHGFFDSLRVEVASLNVHIGLICPGTVDTELRFSAVDTSLGSGDISGSKKNKLSSDQVAKRILSASDNREREIYIPSYFGYAALWGKLLASSLVDRIAAKKYKV